MSQKAKRKTRGRGKTIDSWKMKEWYDVYAPKTFKEEFIAQIPSGNPDNLVGRIMSISLYDFTKSYNDASIMLQFKITKIIGKRCNTIFWGHELTRDYIRSLIHRGATRVDGIFNFTTADNVTYRVSTFLVTRRRAKRSQQKSMRKIIFQVLTEFAKNMTHEKFIQGVISGRFASNITKIAKTIYPLRECKIRKVKVINVPENIKDDFITEDLVFDEVSLDLGEHGKSIKAKKLKKKKEKGSPEDSEPSEVVAEKKE
ncbi:30S ribosomal protein S3ae [Promethearchaeum syntrophicum]|uniref:Small ribosomal subunit protein eS1 n=1 Tax=Promethearchaeum syntrophicum TaxID=2594042 RepID=A0A5B9DCY8_9ARCH|nr:30S ribosomal protein S3ae [Candidatus Prometheoarchaeum syntrophicum]QEE16891.1 30S ribosomal protein S3Ae [Candidatus Prometheoarchaeum syntrophicum]